MEDKIYKTGRIYKLYSHINESYYIGSTHNTLRHRLYGHRGVKGRVSKKVRDWIDDIGADNLMITEIVAFTDLTNKQLKIHEDEEVKQHLGKEYCLNCNRVYIKPEDRPEHKKNKSKIYRATNKDIIRNKKKIYRETNRDIILKHKKEFYEANKEKILKRQREYSKNNRDEILERKRQYCQKHRDDKKYYDKQYRQANKESTKSIMCFL